MRVVALAAAAAAAAAASAAAAAAAAAASHFRSNCAWCAPPARASPRAPCDGAGTVEAGGDYGRVVGRRFVAKAAGQRVRWLRRRALCPGPAPLRRRAGVAPSLVTASLCSPTASSCRSRAGYKFAEEFVIVEGLFLLRFAMVSDTPGASRAVGSPSSTWPGPRGIRRFEIALREHLTGLSA